MKLPVSFHGNKLNVRRIAGIRGNQYDIPLPSRMRGFYVLGSNVPQLPQAPLRAGTVGAVVVRPLVCTKKHQKNGRQREATQVRGHAQGSLPANKVMRSILQFCASRLLVMKRCSRAKKKISVASEGFRQRGMYE